jgi:hypothetical protein
VECGPQARIYGGHKVSIINLDNFESEVRIVRDDPPFPLGDPKPFKAVSAHYARKLVAEIIRLRSLSEREAVIEECAQICDRERELWEGNHDIAANTADRCALAIRALSPKAAK